MRVTTSELEHSQVQLDLEVEEERVQRAMDQAYRRLALRTNVPGFRRGKAPRPLVERVAGKDALVKDAMEALLPAVYDEAVKETGIVPVDKPSLEVIGTAPMRVRAVVPVKPRVHLGDYRSIRVEPPTVDVPDESVDAILRSLQESRAEWVPVNRPTADGDRVTVDVVAASLDSTVLDDRDVEYLVVAGKRSPVPGFSGRMVGLSAGQQSSFVLQVPPDTGEPSDLAGKELTFTVRVHEVKEKQLPLLDDAFAASLGEYASLQALKDKIRGDLEAKAAAEAQERYESMVADAVADLAIVELPPQLVERRKEVLVEAARASLDREGIPVQEYFRRSSTTWEQLEEELRHRARKQVKWSLVSEALEKAEAIDVRDDEIDAELRRMAGGEGTEQAGATPGSDTERRRRVASLLRGRKVLGRMVEIASQPKEESAGNQGTEGADT